jgi:hypothetical protein
VKEEASSRISRHCDGLMLPLDWWSYHSYQQCWYCQREAYCRTLGKRSTRVCPTSCLDSCSKVSLVLLASTLSPIGGPLKRSFLPWLLQKLGTLLVIVPVCELELSRNLGYSGFQP